MSKSPSQSKKVKSTSSSQWRWPALVFLLSFLLYANTLKNFYALDDDIYTRKNKYIQEGFSALPKILFQGSLMGFSNQNDANYRPVVLLDFMIETALFKENPYVNHFFNVLFWSLSNVVLYWFLLRLLKNFNPYIPLFITGLFILHPIHTDVVANIKSRDEILGFLFGISSLLCILRYLDREDKGDMGFAALFFTLAILCKENCVTLFAVAPVMAYTFREIDLKKTLRLTLPFAGVLVVYFLIRSHVLSSLTFSDKNKVDMVNNSLMAAKNYSDMYATNFTMMGRYLRLLFFPYPLSWDYSYNTFPIVSWSNVNAWGSALIYLGLISYAVVRVLKRDVYAFCIVFFLSTLILTSNLIVKILATFAERFLFWPSLAFCIALVFGLCRLFQVDVNGTKLTWPKNLSYLFVGLFLVYGMEVISRIPDWKNNMHLFLSGLDAQPNSARAHFAVASEFRVAAEAQGNPIARADTLNKAIHEYEAGLKIYDKDPEIYFNMGICYADGGQKEKAIEMYTKTLDLRPSYGGARNNLGVYYFNDKKYDKALDCFQTVVKYDSLYSDAYANIGACYENTGRHAEAIEQFKKAAKLNENNYSAYENMSRSSLALHDTAAAKDYTSTAVMIKEKQSKIKPFAREGEFPFAPVSKMLVVTCLIFGVICYTQANKITS
jgi:tetratricopeptide (TPR) repeat protein